MGILRHFPDIPAIQPRVSDTLEEAMVILAFSVLSSGNEKLL